MLRGQRQHPEGCDLLNQDCMLGITNVRESDLSIVMPIDALPEDLDAYGRWRTRCRASAMRPLRSAGVEYPNSDIVTHATLVVQGWSHHNCELKQILG